MQKSIFKSGLVFGIILLFVGSGILTSTGKVNKPIKLVDENMIMTIIDSNYIENDAYVLASKFLKNKESLDCYGFIINVSAHQNSISQTNICKLINNLFQEKVIIYWICENISVLAKNMDEKSKIINRSFEKGIFIVPFTNNSDINSIAIAIIKDYNLSKNIEIYQLNEPLYNIKIHILLEPKIAHYNRPSIDWESYYKCLSEADFCHQEVLTPKDVLNNLIINNFNVFIIGGENQSGSEIIDYLKPITFFANKKISNFVSSGGGFIGSCGGGTKVSSGYYRPNNLPVSVSYFILNYIPFQIKIVDRAIYRALPGGGGSLSSGSGSGVIIKIVNHSCPVSFGLPDIINKTNYWGGPMFLEKKDGSHNSEDLGVIEGLDENGWNWNYSMFYHIPWWCILPEKHKKQLIEKWIEFSKGKALWVTAKFGDGKIIAFGDHPEYCAWEWGNTSKRIIYNAVLYASSKGPFFADIDYVWPLL
jgi:hypothetical protein